MPTRVVSRCSYEYSYEYTVFQKELYDGISEVTIWRMLRKRLYLKVYKLSIVQDVQDVER
jgi:hypothetical protein